MENNNSEILIYQTTEGQTQIEVNRFINTRGRIWGGWKDD